MKIVLVSPNDDNYTTPDVLLVNHPDRKRSFEKDYYKQMECVKALNPETWNIDEVYDRMLAHGWQIIHENAITVEY